MHQELGPLFFCQLTKLDEAVSLVGRSLGTPLVRPTGELRIEHCD